MEKKPLIKRMRIIVIGGSSGSLDVLLVLLPLLNKKFSIPILLVLHRGQAADTGLVELLQSKSSLRIKEVDEKDRLAPGWLYLAPPDYHVLLETDGTLSLDASEKVHYSRPSIEVSFTSASAAYGDALVAILFSGANADGAQAMRVVKEHGGMNIVQDPKEAAVNFMPEQAILHAPVDYVLPAKDIATLLNRLSDGMG
ncbi:MAG: chemotaxis protein CheB [Bacteroidota bacterium]